MAATGRPSDYTPALAAVSCVYALTEPGGEIRYVGQAKNYRRRIASHRSAHGASGDTARARWLRKLEQRGEVAGSLILECTTDLNAAEARWIADLRKQGARLLNIAASANDMNHVREGKAASPWAGRRTPIQIALCQMAETIRTHRKTGKLETVDWLVAKQRQVRAAVDRVRRTEGVAGINRMNAALAERWAQRGVVRA